MTDKVVQNVFRNNWNKNLFFLRDFVLQNMKGVKDGPGGGCGDEDTVIVLISDIDHDIVTWGQEPGVTNQDHLPGTRHHLDKTMEDTQIFPTIIYHNYWIFLWMCFSMIWPQILSGFVSNWRNLDFWTSVKLCVNQIINWNSV